MKQSQLFTKVKRENPKDEISRNANLLLRGGYIHKEMAGAYAMLPLGMRVIENIKAIVREEMNAISGQELLMTALQPKELWEKSGRWNDEVVDVWFKTDLANGTQIGLGCTHEEPIAHALAQFVNSYRDLPQYVYQFQTKFRNELRAKSGIMRGREFLMKDLYSFNTDEAGLDAFYKQCTQAYHRIFDRLGIGNETYYTFASGGMFSKFSHEFQTLSEAGEDLIYVSKEKNIAINEEVLNDEVLEELGLKRDELEERKSIEVGNIFKLGTQYSSAVGLNYMAEDGKEYPVVMGSYGIGIGRAMGTIVELFADDDKLNWPATIAPFEVHLVLLGSSAELKASADKLYSEFTTQDTSVLYDDRDLGIGEKLYESDFHSLPKRIIVSEKNLKSGGAELLDRTLGTTKIVSLSEVVQACHNM